MTTSDYVLALVSVLVAMALSDMAFSVHRLTAHTKSVRWDPIAIMTAFCVLIAVLSMWYLAWWISAGVAQSGFAGFFTVIVEFFLLYMMAARCLPDDPSGEYDLRLFYAENARSIWLWFTLLHLSVFLHWIASVADFSEGSRFWHDFIMIAGGIPLALPLVVWPSRRRLHGIIVSALTLWSVASVWEFRLDGTPGT